MFAVWLVGLGLAVLAPLLLLLALWRLRRPATRPSAVRMMQGGAAGALAGFAVSWVVGLIVERQPDGLSDYWYVPVAVGFTFGVLAAAALRAWRIAQRKVASSL